MKAQTTKDKERQAFASSSIAQRRSNSLSQIKDNRPGITAQRKLQVAASSRSVAQRTKESVDALVKLAKPKIFKVPDVKVQDKLVQELDASLNLAADAAGKKSGTMAALRYNESCLGGIELTSLAKKDNLKDLIKHASLIDIKDNSLGFSTFDLVKGTAMEGRIISNTLSTMHKAGQLDYLQKSGIIGTKYKVVIEIHYVRDRNPVTSKLHKDTLGETLFVNLNYLTDKKIAGPEFVVNPASDTEDKARISRNMPELFADDLEAARSQLKQPESIESSVIGKNGVVAFVDEAIHHMTPMVKHREVSAQQVLSAHPSVKAGYDKYKAVKDSNSQFASFLDADYRRNAEAWYNIMEKIAAGKRGFNRLELEKLPKEKVEALIELGGHDQFALVSIPKFGIDGKTASKPVVDDDRKLKRQMSTDLLKSNMPLPDKDEKRAFFRTWVRIVPA